MALNLWFKRSSPLYFESPLKSKVLRFKFYKFHRSTLDDLCFSREGVDISIRRVISPCWVSYMNENKLLLRPIHTISFYVFSKMPIFFPRESSGIQLLLLFSHNVKMKNIKICCFFFLEHLACRSALVSTIYAAVKEVQNNICVTFSHTLQ